jgi:hypothetical protein
MKYSEKENQKKKKKILVGEKLSAPVQAGPGAHPTFYTMGAVSVSRG